MTWIAKLASVAIAATAFAACQGASAAVYTLYDSLGGIENGGDAIAATGAGPYLNDWFKVDRGATLTSATFNLELGDTPAGSFEVWAAKIDPSVQGGISQYATLAAVSDSTLTKSFATYTFTPATTYTLDPNAFYVVGLYDSGKSGAIWGNTIDPNVLSRPSVTAGMFYFNNGGVQANAGGPYELSVNVAGAVPEPTAWATMLVGFAGLGIVMRRTRRVITA